MCVGGGLVASGAEDLTQVARSSTCT
jgi:hypothetical protein